MGRKRKQTYEENVDRIDNEIRKRKPKWRLTSLCWLDFDDVSQMMRFHIFKKWDQWDQKRDLLPWINKIISNQFKNILRNHYHSFVKPCVGCPFNTSHADSENGCSFTKSNIQDTTCPLYKKWNKSKRHAYSIKIPISIETLPRQNIEDSYSTLNDLDAAIEKVKKELKKTLSEKQYYIFHSLFIDKKPEEEVAIELGYKTNEKGRTAGYKQIKNLKVKFKKIVIKMLEKKDIV